jgi:hypothetical protein
LILPQRPEITEFRNLKKFMIFLSSVDLCVSVVKHFLWDLLTPPRPAKRQNSGVAGVAECGALGLLKAYLLVSRCPGSILNPATPEF